MTHPGEWLAKAEQLADDVLFPHAMAVERDGHVPRSHLDLLALEGFYGLTGPVAAGGSGLDRQHACEVVEILASGCLSTTFVWAQHLGVVGAVARSSRPDLQARWLDPLCRGDIRSGVSYAGTLPGRPLMHARRVEGGWIFDGEAPWFTGWQQVDVLQVTARTDDGLLVIGLFDPTEAVAGGTMSIQPLQLVAVQASATVHAHVRAHFVPEAQIVGTSKFSDWPARDAANLAMNGFMSLGVVRRCLQLLGPSALDDELLAVRAALAAATPESAAQARAGAAALALTASAALLVHAGSSGLPADQHPQRLAREALFLQVFGSRPAIKHALLERYTKA